MPGKSGYDTQIITVFYGDKLVFRMCRSFLDSEEGTARLRGATSSAPGRNSLGSGEERKRLSGSISLLPGDASSVIK